MRSRVWLQHRRREEYTSCPLCNAAIRWIYTGDVWIPCDRETIFFKPDTNGVFEIVKNRELVQGEIYCGGDNEGYVRGLLPHVYSCDCLEGWHGHKYSRGL